HTTEMDSEGNQDCDESFTPLEGETVQEPVVNAILPASSNDNPEVGTEALSRIVREVLEGVFEARMKEISKTL
ncbi:hypothetical protein J1N35_004550, partial [Gossypium stocksii]